MNTPFESFDDHGKNESAGHDDAMLRKLLGELAGGRESAPDLTDAVMGRLGFVRCTAIEAKRARQRVMLQRVAVLLLAISAALAGYLLASNRESSDSSMALVPAMGGAMQRQGRSFEVLFAGMPRWRASEQAPSNASRYPISFMGPVPVLIIPVPVQTCPPCEEADLDCPSLRRAAAAVPFPQT